MKKPSELSVRCKAYIFIVLSIIALFIIGHSVMSNINKDKIISKPIGKTVQSNQPKVNESTNKEIIKSQDDEKQSKLQSKYQEGYTAFHNSKYSDAISIEDEVIKEDPNFYQAYSVKGIAQCYSNNYDAGMQNIDKALQIKSDYGYGRFNKALAYELYGHYDDALEWYDKALSVENYIWSYYGKASIYGRRGDVENTVKNLKIAIDMDSSVKDVARGEKDFNNVRGNKEFDDLLK